MISFKWRHFNKMIIMLAIRWYLSYSLSYRDVEELLLERGFKVDHTTVYRWVVNYADQLEASFRQKHKKSKAHRSWRMDETYIKIKGKDYYLYRAVDKDGDTLEFMLSEKRDEASAFKFLKKAVGQHGLAECITIDKSGANEAAIIFLNCMLYLIGLWSYYWVEDRQIKYLNESVTISFLNIQGCLRSGLSPFLSYKWNILNQLELFL